MSQIFTDFGPSQRWDFVMPNAKQVVRCPFQDCNTLINSNGIQRSITIHFRQCHKEVTRPLVVKVKRPDSFKVTTYFVPGRPQAQSQLNMPTTAQTENGPPDPHEPIQTEAPTSPKHGKTDRSPTLEQEGEETYSTLGFDDDGNNADLPPIPQVSLEKTTPEPGEKGLPTGPNPDHPSQKPETLTPKENDGPKDSYPLPEPSDHTSNMGRDTTDHPVHPAEPPEIDTDSTTIDPEMEGDLSRDRTHQVGAPQQTHLTMDTHAAYLGLKAPRATQGRRKASKGTQEGNQPRPQEGEEDDADMPGNNTTTPLERFSSITMRLTTVTGTPSFPLPSKNVLSLRTPLGSKRVLSRDTLALHLGLALSPPLGRSERIPGLRTRVWGGDLWRERTETGPHCFEGRRLCPRQ